MGQRGLAGILSLSGMCCRAACMRTGSGVEPMVERVLRVARAKTRTQAQIDADGCDDGLGEQAQRVSSISQVGFLAAFKQWIAQSIAGDYNKEAVNRRIDEALDATPVVMFSFTTCPFCLKAKALLKDEAKVAPSQITIIECDEDPEGNAIRAELGLRTGRTSMPSIWIKGEGYIGGCNDGPGIVPLFKNGSLMPMLSKAGAVPEF